MIQLRGVMLECDFKAVFQERSQKQFDRQGTRHSAFLAQPEQLFV